jgi:glutathione S-transferase
MRLYHRDASLYSYKVRLLLGFLDVPFEGVQVARLPSGKNDVDQAYLALNPRAQIPTLDDDGMVLWGSTAILTYVALRHDPARQWMPQEPRRAAEVMQWLELAQNEVRSGLFMTRAISRFGYQGDLATARAAGFAALRILDERLCGRTWLVGEHPTLADLACFPEVVLSDRADFGIAEYGGVCAWVQRFQQLRGFIPPVGLPA